MYFPIPPALQQQAQAVPAGNQAGAVRYRTKAKKVQPVKRGRTSL